MTDGRVGFVKPGSSLSRAFNKIKIARNEQGLGAKLGKYYIITIVRYCFVSMTGLILATGFSLDAKRYLHPVYMAQFLATGFLRPTGPAGFGRTDVIRAMSGNWFTSG